MYYLDIDATVVLTYIHKCIHTYIHAYIHTYIHTYIYAYIHTFIRTCIHKHQASTKAASIVQIVYTATALTDFMRIVATKDFSPFYCK